MTNDDAAEQVPDRVGGQIFASGLQLQHNFSLLYQEIILEFTLPTLPNWMLIHTPENRRRAVPGPNYLKTDRKYTD